MMKTLNSHPIISENLLYHRIYWLNQLAGELPETNILTDYLRPDRYSRRNKVIQFELGDRLSQSVIQLGQNSHLSIYLLLLSAFSSLLNQYTHHNDLIVGIPCYHPIDQDEALTNQANQVLPLRLQLTDELTFKDLLLHIKDAVIQAYTHQEYPLDKLLGALNIPQQSSRCALYDIIILLENIHSHPVGLNNDLTISWCVNETKIVGRIEYSDSLFRDETIEALAKHYVNTIECAIANPTIKVSDIVLLKADETQKLLEEFNSNTKLYPVDQTIQSLFEAQVERSPNSIAGVYQGKSLTYRELNAGANQLAGFLRDLGIGNGDFVGILQERNLDFLRSILAILKAGGAYVPIDRTYPLDRIQYMLSNSEVKVLLTEASCLQDLAERLEHYPHLKSVICLEISDDQAKSQFIGVSLYDRSDFSQYSEENIESSNSSTDRAYMLYTSGSTGLPKGAIVRHDGAINHIYAQFDALKLHQGLRFLQSAPASSDISVWQFLAPLLIGGCTLIVDTATVCDPEKLFQVIQAENLTLVELVPVVLQGLIDYVSKLPAQQRSLPQLQWMMVTGESVPVRLVNQWLTLYPTIPAVNAYGPTEAADDITQLIVEQPLPENQRSIPIGKPLANLTLYVLDAQMRLVPIGVPGEICVAGIGVGNGYWKNASKTNLSFVPNPFTNPESVRNHQDVIYKTGDLGRWLPDGTIEYLGRIDHQVKIRGFRIELGEIEAALSHHSALKEAVVVVRDDRMGNKHLVAYVVPDASIGPVASDLRDFLQAKLPDYMVPSAFVLIDRLPLTPSGKVDRAALPEPEIKSLVPSGSDAATTSVEEILVGIWSRVLSCDRVGIHDNFFELGGHSLLATLIISQVRQVFQRELPLRCLFELPTIAQLAAAIETVTLAGLEAPAIERHVTGGTIPLSFAQQRLWFLAQLEPENPFYNLSTAASLQGSLNYPALEQTFTEILRRHEALRTKVTVVEGQPIAIVTPATALPLPVIDLSALPQSQQETEVKKYISIEGQQPFDLNRDLLLRVKLLRLEAGDHILLLTMHHSAADGWSIGVLVNEVSALYKAFCQQQPSPLPELPIQYGDFAIWQRQWLQGAVLDAQMGYWRQQLADAPTQLQLPTDRPRPAIQSYRGTTHSFRLSLELLRSLHHLSQQARCTLFMTLLAAFNVLLGRYSNSEDIVVGTPIANRHRTEVEGLIGCFVNTLVLRTDLSNNPTVLELLEQVRDMALDAYAHQDLPFEQLVEVLQPQRSLSHTPLFQVMFVLQNAPIPNVELPGLQVRTIETDRGTAQFDLMLLLEETTEGLVGTIEYNTDLFELDTIARMVGHYQTLLKAMAANLDRPISDLPLLTSVEQQQFSQWNQAQTDYPQTLCIHQLFEAQVQRTPNAIAVIFEDQQLTYQELNIQANQLAHDLRTVGVKPEDWVGICCDRSIEMLIGVLGILKAGGAYVPLDPTYPIERLEWMLQDAQVSLLLTQEHLRDRLPDQVQFPLICVDRYGHSGSTAAAETILMPPDSGVTPDSLAYVIYTSGSTGTPKGVQIEHRSVVNLLHVVCQQLGVTAADTLLAVTPLSFDVAVSELFLPLAVGAKLVLASRAVAADGIQLLALLQRCQATVLHPTPATWRLLLAAGWQPTPNLKMISTGEALPPSLAHQLLCKGGELWNLYGPTETTIWATGCQIQSAELPIAIGRPLANLQAYILDRHLHPVPIGVPGELYIGGVGLARGYLNRPELTAERFIPHPFSDRPGARLYKTGDLARFLADGQIECLGRIDHQVKLRGFRIELGEIEAVLNQQVRESVVVIQTDPAGEPCLVAYVVLQSEPFGATRDLRRFLQDKLPDYMVPVAFVPLEALPLNSNGKVDRALLPQWEMPRSGSDSGSDVVSPRTATEVTLSTLWAEVLGLEAISIHDNFFELGGHSLLVTRVISRLRAAFEVELPLRSLFEKPTVAELAERIDILRLSLAQASNPLPVIGNGRKEIEL
ncbi:MAG: amino acid adenylation domain-containing protein [Drouetiella hepatica Uher 2000/2452]|uniref:Amino acid adenylation domain-containing protein n=1 Tax=Drouetiella hepatica Uher 2000/2452 TaxID=904376 RepID=A0A951QGF6_9CYAN|nr:amino acid adenylation domain-containing protein [Drouetiella hepatica Uher 2000/2452]